MGTNVASCWPDRWHKDDVVWWGIFYSGIRHTSWQSAIFLADFSVYFIPFNCFALIFATSKNFLFFSAFHMFAYLFPFYLVLWFSVYDMFMPLIWDVVMGPASTWKSGRTYTVFFTDSSVTFKGKLHIAGVLRDYFVNETTCEIDTERKYKVFLFW